MKNMIAVEKIIPGTGIKTWFGSHTVVSVMEYVGPFHFIHNILRFSNGLEMSTEKGRYLELVD